MYQTFDSIVLLSHGHALYSGPGSFAPAEYFTRVAPGFPYQQGYNVADYLLEVASDPPVGLFQMRGPWNSGDGSAIADGLEIDGRGSASEKGPVDLNGPTDDDMELCPQPGPKQRRWSTLHYLSGFGSPSRYAATFLTQLEVLSGREWKILRR